MTWIWTLTLTPNRTILDKLKVERSLKNDAAALLASYLQENSHATSAPLPMANELHVYIASSSFASPPPKSIRSLSLCYSKLPH
mmetsp:Transcript_81180/g.169569  ORF Transcript_81180/g.169569 Transcript_81180/m.169569 type:complete len:84 (-) Transcript_81180:232-483(-)